MNIEYLNIVFDEENHRYWIDGHEVPSVTQVIAEVVPDFPRQEMAERVARRDGKPVETILDDWDRARDEGLDRGHHVHKFIESILAGKAPHFAHSEVFMGWWAQLSQTLSPIACEAITGSARLGVAGTVDAVFWSKLDRCYHIFDWKTNQKFSTSGKFGSMLPPFNDLSKCDLNIYSLQVSIYRLLLEEWCIGGGFGDSWIVHLSDRATAYQVLDLRERAEAWLLSRPTNQKP